MTREEFDVWIEQHYGELLAVAKRRTNSDDDAMDVLHSAIAGALANETYVNVQAPWTFFVNAVRGYADAKRKSDNSNKRLRSEVKIIHRASFSHGRKPPAPRAE